MTDATRKTSASVPATIRVTSTTRRTFTPDVANVSVSINGEHDAREECVAEFNERYEMVCRALLAAGVDADAITTENFSVSMRQRALYLPYENGGGYYWCKQVADGYDYYGNLMVKVAADAELVGKVWVALNDCGDGVTFNISYDLKDHDAACTSLMGDAVKEALAKASALAAGAGREVGEVLGISFGSDLSRFDTPREYGIRSAKMFAMAEECCDAGAGAPSLTPRSIEIACDVQVECALV